MGRAYRVATTAVAYGGGIGVAGLLGALLLAGQARLARYTIERVGVRPPACDGTYGTEHDGVPLRLAMLGDSSAVGYGVDRPRDTLGALLAAGLAERLHRPVKLHCFAMIGAISADLAAQLEQVLAWQADVVVLLIGANDVAQLIRPSIAVPHLAATVRALRGTGVEVVVGTCPDLGSIQPIQQPLRWLAGQRSRELAAAQTMAVVEAGGFTVSLGNLLGRQFARSPEMFSIDRFHPSAAGYRAASAAILPTVLVAAGVPVEREPVPVPGDGVRSLAQAAVEAVDRAGTEVSGTKVAGQERGPAGRWAALRHRLRARTERPQDPVEPSGVGDEVG